jgi:hypothetical protein
MPNALYMHDNPPTALEGAPVFLGAAAETTSEQYREDSDDDQRDLDFVANETMKQAPNKIRS